MSATRAHESYCQMGLAERVLSLGKEMTNASGQADVRQIQKMHVWSVLMSFIGYATAWILLNPASILLMAFGNFTRWSVVFHGINHGVFDAIDSAPKFYQSHRFACGWRRFIDWPDWILPDCWAKEHNHLHHHFTGSQKDPDIVWRNTRHIRNLKIPLPLKYLLAFIVSLIWKPFYYAPNTLVEARFAQGKVSSPQITLSTWSPFCRVGRELWLKSLLPYIGYRFVLLPGLFLLLSSDAAISVLISSVFAELLANFLGFATIATNHTGEDVPIFSGAVSNRDEYFRRQIEGSVNLPTGHDFIDFLYGGLNYQIEHHLWPKGTLLQYQKVRPQLRELCRSHGITYREEPLLRRLVKTFEIIVGVKEPFIVENLSC